MYPKLLKKSEISENLYYFKKWYPNSGRDQMITSGIANQLSPIFNLVWRINPQNLFYRLTVGFTNYTS